MNEVTKKFLASIFSAIVICTAAPLIEYIAGIDVPTVIHVINLMLASVGFFTSAIITGMMNDRWQKLSLLAVILCFQLVAYQIFLLLK